MQLRFRHASGHPPLPHPCLWIYPENAQAWISATAESWTPLSVVPPDPCHGPAPHPPHPAQPSPWPHPEGDESQPVILSVNDFLHDDLHTVVHHLLLWPILSALLQGPRPAATLTVPASSSLPSAPPGPAGQDMKGQWVRNSRVQSSNLSFLTSPF